jgi:hypothetical protein
MKPGGPYGWPESSRRSLDHDSQVEAFLCHVWSVSVLPKVLGWRLEGGKCRFEAGLRVQAGSRLEAEGPGLTGSFWWRLEAQGWEAGGSEFQAGGSRSEAGGSRVEGKLRVAGWKLRVRSWRLRVGGWRLRGRGWRLEARG